MAELAELHGLSITPHFAGSPVGMMACVHVACTIPNLIAVEFHAVGVPWWDTLIRGVGKPLIEDGFIQVSDAPGLGFELDREAVAEHVKAGITTFE